MPTWTGRPVGPRGSPWRRRARYRRPGRPRPPARSEPVARRANYGSQAVVARHRDRGQSARAGADHVRRPLDKYDPNGRLGRGVRDQPQPRTAVAKHLRRAVMTRRVAQKSAQLAVMVADRDGHAPSLHPHPSSSRVAREHTRRCSSCSTRGGHLSAASRERASTSCCSAASSSIPAGASGGPSVPRALPTARRRRTAASGDLTRGRAVGDHQVDRAARRKAARERAASYAPPAVLHPQQCHAPFSRLAEQDGSRSPCARPDRRSTPPAPRVAPTPAARLPAPHRSHGYSRPPRPAHAALSPTGARSQLMMYRSWPVLAGPQIASVSASTSRRCRPDLHVVDELAANGSRTRHGRIRSRKCRRT